MIADIQSRTGDPQLPGAGGAARSPTREVSLTPLGLPGTLMAPAEGRGIVVFAHGSGSSRSSPRNRFVAETLHQAGLGVLLFDLLTPSEAQDKRNVFNVARLAERLTQATEWLQTEAELSTAPTAYFGASTGAAAALVAETISRRPIAAVVSRGGRPDLAGIALVQVRAPTLLIVGGRDTDVLELNRQALDALTCEKHLEIVPGAGHLFEEPGALETVAGLARAWFAPRLTREGAR